MAYNTNFRAKQLHIKGKSHAVSCFNYILYLKLKCYNGVPLLCQIIWLETNNVIEHVLDVVLPPDSNYHLWTTYFKRKIFSSGYVIIIWIWFKWQNGTSERKVWINWIWLLHYWSLWHKSVLPFIYQIISFSFCRLTRLEETMEKLYKPSSAIVYSKEVLHQRMKYDESNGTDIFDQSLLLRILQRS